MNERPKAGDSFLIKEKWRFTPPFTTYHTDKEGNKRIRTIVTFIDLEIYKHNIIVLSFYNKGVGRGKNKYKAKQSKARTH